MTYLEVATRLAGFLKSSVWVRPPRKSGRTLIAVCDHDPDARRRTRGVRVWFDCPADPAVTPWTPGGEVDIDPASGQWGAYHRTPLKPVYVAAASGGWAAAWDACAGVAAQARAEQINTALSAPALVVGFRLDKEGDGVRPAFWLNPAVTAPGLSMCWYAWGADRLEDGADLLERVRAILEITRAHHAALEAGEVRGSPMPPRPTGLISPTEYAAEQVREQERLRREWEALPESGETHGGGFYDD